MRKRTQRILAALSLTASVALIASGCSSTAPVDAGSEDGEVTQQLTAGWVSSVDQIALPAALDQGFFEEQGIDVSIADPFASGVDMLNALQADQIQIAQVGAPVIGAILKGADYVIVGNYSGSASQFGIDETMSLVASEDSGISPDDLTTLEGKKIGVTVGSINYLYMLAILESVGLTKDDVTVVNMSPADMAVAVQKGGVDAATSWDPFPLMVEDQAEGSYTVVRGGEFISYIGYFVAQRSFVEENPELVEKFITARAEGDMWVRDNLEDASQLATRWMPNLDLEIAKQSIDYNYKQLDPRISACNYAGLNAAVQTLADLEVTTGTFDVNDVFMPAANLKVQQDHPELFEGLDVVPDSAVVGDGFVFDPSGSQCPTS